MNVSLGSAEWSFDSVSKKKVTKPVKQGQIAPKWTENEAELLHRIGKERGRRRAASLVACGQMAHLETGE